MQKGLKPLNKEFYEVMDIKSMLETAFVNNYPCIELGQNIKINSEIEVTVVSLEPYEICSTNNIDLNVEFVEMDKEEEEEEEEEEEHLTREELRAQKT